VSSSQFHAGDVDLSLLHVCSVGLAEMMLVENAEQKGTNFVPIFCTNLLYHFLKKSIVNANWKKKTFIIFFQIRTIDVKCESSFCLHPFSLSCQDC
jgi:hypothetical protein